jgi:hypothetical protein
MALLCVQTWMVGMLIIRIPWVSAYRGEVLRMVSVCAGMEERKGWAWQWRYERLNDVSFDDMMWQWYKPPSWFYTDQAFMRCAQ